jgi:ubiquinone/menaquinone biosynthesis C-methylase UbiE
MSVELLLRRLLPAKGATVLDLGCGNGNLVRVLRQEGLDAYGCDFADTAGSDLSSQDIGELLLPIPPGPYRIPFEDSRFDYVISSQVLEHVMDYPGTFAEIRRVLKPGGISLHVFPPRHVLIEPHVFVPLASVIRNQTWLYFWAFLGIRNQFQAGKAFREVARLNYNYLRNHTNYLSKAQILRHATRFSEAAFREDVFFEPSAAEKQRQSLKKRIFVKLFGDKLRVWIYGTFVMRALYLRK